MDIAHLNNISFSYDKKNNIIDGLTLAFHKGKFEGILGESGCGKTTILNIILGKISPDAGDVIRNFVKVGVVLQSDSLIENLSALKNVQYVCRDEVRSLECLEMVGLKEYAYKKTKFLSKGMKKRVEIARALAVVPDLIIMDEPFGNLDYLTKINLVSIIKHFIKGINSSFIYITHDIDEALIVCDNITIFPSKPLRNNYERIEGIQGIDRKELKNRIKRIINGKKEFSWE
ncbi:MAG: ATP-binding cassette domain-containing protein [Calditerrivibrio sp.]|nr:ATP-binding cassette domain-containing protein [Calditerrivibrio sp.]